MHQYWWKNKTYRRKRNTLRLYFILQIYLWSLIFLSLFSSLLFLPLLSFPLLLPPLFHFRFSLVSFHFLSFSFNSSFIPFYFLSFTFHCLPFVESKGLSIDPPDIPGSVFEWVLASSDRVTRITPCFINTGFNKRVMIVKFLGKFRRNDGFAEHFTPLILYGWIRQTVKWA